MNRINLRQHKTVSERRKALEEELKVSLKNIGSFSLDEAVASSRNCENMIGVAQVPLGVAGPLKISPEPRAQSLEPKEYYIPLATTEGALVASVNRGCKAITESGGAMVISEQIGATRGSIFRVKMLKDASSLKEWIVQHWEELRHVAVETSRHLLLLKADCENVGTSVFVRWYFDTQDAMGMNMATIAATKLANHIEAKTSAICVSVAGNFDVDKKPAWLNVIRGRGKKVWAEVRLPQRILQSVLKSTAFDMYKVWLNKDLLGSALSGSMAFNAHFANIIAAIFIATGQDAAHVAECSVGITTVKPEDQDLYASVYLPDLMVGTVGGGTGLATQKEALEILGIAGGNGGKNAQKLAEIIGGAVLAGEISLLASLAEGTLAEAHEKLARGKNDK